MKLTFIGSGSAFTLENYQSNMVLESDSKERLLIDCGSDARWALNDLGLTYKDIDAVYISHLHADHIGGLEWLAFTRYFDPAKSKQPLLFVPKLLVSDLWERALSAGLTSLEDRIPSLSTYFEVIPIQGTFTWSKIKFELCKTIHTVSNNDVMPSYGLLFKFNNLRILISTDTKFNLQQLKEWHKQSDVIFHDCETSLTKSGVHAHYDELVTLDDTIKAKMWLYHYNPGKLPDAKKDGFKGFVKKGQSFDLECFNNFTS